MTLSAVVCRELWTGKVAGSGCGIILYYYPAICLRGRSKTEKVCNEICVRAEIRKGHLPNTNWSQFARFEPVPKHLSLRAYRRHGGNAQRILQLTKYGGVGLLHAPAALKPLKDTVTQIKWDVRWLSSEPTYMRWHGKLLLHGVCTVS